jgi:glutathione S-transferase
VNVILVSGIVLEDDFPAIYAWWERIWQRDAVKKGVRVPSGEIFSFGYEVMRSRMKADPKAWEETERPLIEALEQGRQEVEGQ